MSAGPPAATEATAFAHDLGAVLAWGEPPPQTTTEAALAGQGFVAKDNIDTADLPTTWATPRLAGRQPANDAVVVERLRAAGAHLVGKANLHELCFGATGTHAGNGGVANPWDPTRVAGGSSSGSAVAVAVGLVPFALGTDTGGSCRIPAAWCGVVGFRPTTGRYPMQGVLALSPTRDTIGPIVGDVAWLPPLDDVLRGAGRTPTAVRDPGSLRLGVPWRDPLVGDVDPSVREVFDDSVDRLVAAGVAVVEVDAAPLWRLDLAAGFPIALYEIERELTLRFGALAALADEVASPDVAELLREIDRAPVDSGAYHAAIHRDRRALRRAYRDLLEAHGLDAIAMPTVPVPPPRTSDAAVVRLPSGEHDAFAALTRNTSPSSVAGVPSISVPAGRGGGSVPVGLLLDGRVDQDAALIATAHAITEVLAG